MDFYDFFSGCGGTSQGMREAGLRVRLGVDLDTDAAETFRANFPEASFACRDIRRMTAKDLEPYLDKRKARARVFGACAPCQPFTKQRCDRKSKDGRRDLLLEFHRFVRRYLPEYVFIENVPGLQSVDEEEGPFAQFVRLLERLGYWHAHKIIFACHYGVPQTRRRLVLLASRLGPIAIPKPTHGPDASNKVLPTVWKAISGLPPIKAGETHTEIPNHRAANLSDLNLRRIRASKPGGTRASWPRELILSCHDKHTGHTDVYGRMAKNAPATALTTRCISFSNGRFGHPTQNRAISIREAACLQTFPMSFEFFGNLNSMSRQVGNAVPVAMARAFGEAILQHYSQYQLQVTA